MKLPKHTFIMGLSLASLLLTLPLGFAKIRPPSTFKPKGSQVGFVKDVQGHAVLKILRPISSLQDGLLQFQNGKLTDEIEFYKSPRCYLHFKKNAEQEKLIPLGLTLKANKIDNSYLNGSVHVVFWFDEDSNVSDLTCVTNYSHTITLNELSATLGDSIEVSVSKSVETDVLFNTVPVKESRVLSEDSEKNNFPVQSIRANLKGM